MVPYSNTVIKYLKQCITSCVGRARLRHRPTRPWPRTRSFRGPVLSKVKEMCRHGYSLSHEKSEKMFWIVTWPISHRFRDKRQFPSKIANFSHPHVCIAPAGIGYRPRAPQSFNLALGVGGHQNMPPPPASGDKQTPAPTVY